MKKIILILIVLIPVSVQAQRFGGGIVAGLNVSQIDGDFWEGYNKAGLVGGAFVYTELTDRWIAQMEIRYSAKGSSTSNNNSYQRKYKLQYVEIPLTVKFRVVDKLYAEAGLSFGYLFSAAQNDGDGYIKFEDLPKRTETAVCAGISYLLFERVDVSARYSYSIFPIWETYPQATYGTGAWFNNVITFGFYFRIG